MRDSEEFESLHGDDQDDDIIADKFIDFSDSEEEEATEDHDDETNGQGNETRSHASSSEGFEAESKFVHSLSSVGDTFKSLDSFLYDIRIKRIVDSDQLRRQSMAHAALSRSLAAHSDPGQASSTHHAHSYRTDGKDYPPLAETNAGFNGKTYFCGELLISIVNSIYFLFSSLDLKVSAANADAGRHKPLIQNTNNNNGTAHSFRTDSKDYSPLAEINAVFNCS